MATNYTQLGNNNSNTFNKVDTFPDMSIYWWDLLHFRNYTAAGLARIIYYASFVVAIVLLVGQIVVFTIAAGAGGFFLGLLYGVIMAFFVVAGARVTLEIALSVFSMRESLAIMAAQHNGSNNVRPISISTPSPTYQATSYDNAVQPQSPSVFEPTQYQGYQTQE